MTTAVAERHYLALAARRVESQAQVAEALHAIPMDKLSQLPDAWRKHMTPGERAWVVAGRRVARHMEMARWVFEGREADL